MNIVHISTADNRGGAGHAAFQLHTGLLKAGHDSSMLVGQKWEDRADVERISWPSTIPGRMTARLVLEVETRTGLQYLIQPNRRKILRHHWIQEADIIQLHNLHGNFFSPLVLPELARKAPLVWTLHDTWALTGHCSYNHDCERWRIGCGECPNLAEYPPIQTDTTALLFREKNRLYRDSALTIVTPSRWLYRMACESPLTRWSDIRHIPYGVDTAVFHPPADRAALRQRRGIPVDARVMMIIAEPNAERKGLPYFLEALKFLNLPNLWILVVGSRGLVPNPGFPMIQTGYLNSPEEMNESYGLADVFVLPTLADNLPLSLLEALACGVPSVAFDVGGVVDIVRPMLTGYLARPRDSRDLAHGIETILQSRSLTMSQKCRGVAVVEYGRELQAMRYSALYTEKQIEAQACVACP